MMDLFAGHSDKPLADRLRPEFLDHVVGQEHLLQLDAPIGRMINQKRLASMILWGPPGCGKTTIARLLADEVDMAYEPISAVFSGVAELRKVFERARDRIATGKKTLLFVDEVHRFNRSQQDSFLPYVEDGTVILIGATTENPSFELIGALLSRCQVFVLRRINDEALEKLMIKVETLEGRQLPLNSDGRIALKAMADGDARFLLNLIEELLYLPVELELDASDVASHVQRRAPNYDKNGEHHFNLISALHKSIRGSDVDASLYWLARMLIGGEDTTYILRRLARCASEDIGMADPQALSYVLACWDAYERIGSPEGDLNIAHSVVYLATAPKSNAVYKAFGSVVKKAKDTGTLMPPKHILNAPTKLMKNVGYGTGYLYDHNSKNRFSGQNYFPEGLEREKFYHPNEVGFEREVKKRLEYWEQLRDQLKS